MVLMPYFDLADPAQVDGTVAALRPDVVVHLAAKTFVHSSDLAAFYAVNQVGTFTLLDALARYVPGCHAILASSATVYGSNAVGTVGEACVPLLNSHYGISNLGMELGAALWCDRLRITIVRPFNYTGVGQDPSFLILKIVDHFRRRAPTILLGNLVPARDYGGVRVAAAYAELIKAPPVDGAVNLCTGIGHSFDIAARLNGYRPDVVVDSAFVWANDTPYLVADPARLQALLPSWRSISLKDTIAWILAEPDVSA